MWFSSYRAKRRIVNMIRYGAQRSICPWCGQETAVYPAALEPTHCSPIYGGLTVPVSGTKCQHCGRDIQVYQGMHPVPWRKREEFADGCVRMTWGEGHTSESSKVHAPHDAFMLDSPVWQMNNPNPPEPYIAGTRLIKGNA